jgi:hypothetical protein
MMVAEVITFRLFNQADPKQSTKLDSIKSLPHHSVFLVNAKGEFWIIPALDLP